MQLILHHRMLQNFFNIRGNPILTHRRNKVITCYIMNKTYLKRRKMKAPANRTVQHTITPIITPAMGKLESFRSRGGPLVLSDDPAITQKQFITFHRVYNHTKTIHYFSTSLQSYKNNSLLFTEFTIIQKQCITFH